MVATVITCFIAGYELNSSGETWRKVAEMFMATERPTICIERVARLAVDGKNLNHEDCKMSNVGSAPRCYLVREVKEYLIMNFTGPRVPQWVRRIVVPIQFYQYGVLSQELCGVIYEKKGENARAQAFEHYKMGVARISHKITDHPMIEVLCAAGIYFVADAPQSWVNAVDTEVMERVLGSGLKGLMY